MLVSQAQLQSAFIAWSLVYMNALKRVPVIWPQLATLIPSPGQTNRYAWLSQHPHMRKWEGERVVNSLATRFYEVANELYEDTIGIDMVAFQTDQIGVYAQTMAQFAEAVGQWQEDLVIGAVRNGSTRLCYDGQPMYDTAHPVDINDTSKGTFSNFFTGTSLTAANFDAVYAAHCSRRGEAGVELQTAPTHLIVPPQLRATAFNICNSDNLAAVAAGATGQGTQSNPYKGWVQPLVVNRLAGDPTRWYLAKLDGPGVRPWIVQQNYAPRLVPRVSLDDPHVFDFHELLIGADAYGAAGYGLPHFVSACQA